MRVLFVYPNLLGMNMLPPAIGLLAAILKHDGHVVDVFDSTNWLIPGETAFDSDKRKEEMLQARPTPENPFSSPIHGNAQDGLLRKIQTFSPDLLAFSVNEDQFPIAVSLVEAVKTLRIPTIFGGVFPTFAPEKCLAVDGVDMVCVGEGERALRRLCQIMGGHMAHGIPTGIWFKSKGSITKNGIGELADLDANPLPDYSMFEEARYYRPMQGKLWRMFPVETHRGCLYKCKYCNSPSQRKQYNEIGMEHFRKKSLSRVREELLLLKNNYRAEGLYFWADAFLLYSAKELDEFVEIYSDICLPFWCQSRPEHIQEKKIRKLMNVGLFRMGLGVEHGNESFRKQVLGRDVSNSTIVEKLEILNRLELNFSVNNIVGFPDETRDLAMDTVRLNRRIHADSYNCYSFSPFHGTPLRKLAEERGYCHPDLIARSLTRPTMLNMPQFPPDAIEGFRRCFVLYLKMPETRWQEIRRAEILDAEGDKIWHELIKECQAHNK